jgi:hypothetical protein
LLPRGDEEDQENCSRATNLEYYIRRYLNFSLQAQR